MKQIDLFSAMAEMRYFDEACLEGVPTMEIHGELHTGIGQEAISAGFLGNINDEDAIVSTHRNHFHALIKGVDPYLLMSEIFEKETGLCNGFGGHMHPFSLKHNFSATGIVGQSLPVALGYAYGYKIRNQNNVAVGITGDGGSNQGTFHETLNIAGAWKLPLLVLIENNGLGISVPIAEVLSTKTISERSIAYSAFGKQVDGNDPEVVYEAIQEAMSFIRSGNGPAIIEATCNRFRGHYEGDTDHYRSKSEKQSILKNDPILKYSNKLIESKVCTSDEIENILKEAKNKMFSILEKVRKEKMPPPEIALENIFYEKS